jgi:hypothetical protein
MDLTRTNAVAYLANLPIHDPRSLVDVEVEVPPPGPRDLAVEVYAVSVNPVDVKVRASSDPGACPRSSATTRPAWSSRVGSDVELFEVADEVYYAGSIARSGSNAGLQLVDERVVGHKPSSRTSPRLLLCRSRPSPRGRPCSTSSASSATPPGPCSSWAPREASARWSCNWHAG